MKKFLSIITSAILVASLAGCGGATNSADGSNTVNKDNITIGIAQFAEHPLLKTVVRALFRVLLKQATKRAKTLLLTTKMLKLI